MIKKWAVAIIFFGVSLFTSPIAFAQEDSKQAPALDDYLREPEVRAVSLSPDGTKLAVVKRIEEEKYKVFILDLTDKDKVLAAINEPDDMYATGLRWLSHERLGIVFTIIGNYRGHRVRYSRIVAVDIDGGNPIRLLEGERRTKRNFNLSTIVSNLPSQPDHVLTMAFDKTLSLYRINVKTGAAKKVMRGGPHTCAFKVDSEGNASVRIDCKRKSRSIIVYIFDTNKNRWTKVTSIHATDIEEELGKLIATSEGNTSLLILKRKGEDQDDEKDEFAKLHRYDIKTGTYRDIVYEIEGRDIYSMVMDPYTDEVVGISYISDREHYVFFDEELQAVQSHLEDQFPNGTVDILQHSNDKRRFLFFSSEPWRRGAYYLYDNQEKRIQQISDVAPHLRSFEATSVDEISYRTKDGFLIEGLLTFPKGKDNSRLPLIVFPHGGPAARDQLNYDPIVQYWATRGYAVFQPNFRGSTGYGRTFQNSGNHEYGGKMIEDIASGIKALIKAGRVNSKKVCAAGVSYGGYAALMLAIDTDLLVCTVSINGPVDLELQMKHDAIGVDDKLIKQEIREWQDLVIGNVDTQQKLLQSQSPLHRVNEIAAPVLLIHSKDDGRVWVRHSRRLNSALRKAKKDVEFIELKEGGHSLRWGDAKETVLRKTEAFFAKHLKPELAATEAE